ncbi:MAG: nickel-responsive transcriptional regulator NikR [Candidatus Thiodiazotropha sp. (ex Notomyrtea botanica)]|nr:nickel-responsive transcriptional regulator NikR [Candidatus Thiodiazotropha sp. (ex Notomyrtea botanica)]
MERITISLDTELAAEFDGLIKQHGYRNRSEAVRDLIRLKLESKRLEQEVKGYCVGTITYVYNHEERELASRLTTVQHEHHDLAVSTMHVHLDHDDCLETVVVNGPTAQVRAFAEEVIARPGVRHGQLHLIPVEAEHATHEHGHGKRRHLHRTPRT